MEPSHSGKAEHSSAGAVSPRLVLALATFFCMLAVSLSLYATQPAWWNSRGAVNPGATRNDYAMANEGQLKQFTQQAVKEMNANLPAFGAGNDLNSLVAGWIADYSANGYSAAHPKPSDFQAVNVGQVKYIGGIVWNQLLAAGYTSTLPSWLVVTSSDSQAANLGQLKTVFDFDLTYSSTGSTLPDWWLIHNFGSVLVDGTTVNPNADPSGDGMTNYQNYENGTDPILKDNPAVGLEVSTIVR